MIDCYFFEDWLRHYAISISHAITDYATLAELPPATPSPAAAIDTPRRLHTPASQLRH